jgi:hypothetical protein
MKNAYAIRLEPDDNDTLQVVCPSRDRSLGNEDRLTVDRAKRPLNPALTTRPPDWR